MINSETKDTDAAFRKNNSFRLFTAISGVIFLSLILVGFSYVLYTKSSQYKYDTARPDVKTVSKSMPESATEDRTSSVDENTIKQTKKLLSTYSEALQSINDFNDKPISNTSIGLEGVTRATQESP